MADLEQPLLGTAIKRVFANCPGCKITHLYAPGAAPPYRELVLVSLIMLINGLITCFFYPFLYFMVQDMHFVEREEDIGYYAGYIASAFMLGRWITSMYWGGLSDRHGRKPVLIAGLAAVVIFNITFGFSTTFWEAFMSRFLLGIFNGTLGPAKAYASEICNDEHQAFGVAMLGTMLGLSMIIGPAVGGYFSQPNLKYPQIFPRGSVFSRYPYAIPPLIVAAIGMTVLLIILFQLPESVHMHDDEAEKNKKRVGDEEEGNSKAEAVEKPKSESLFTFVCNRPLLSAVIVYLTWSLHDMAYSEVFSLWTVSPFKMGGLSFTTTQLGNVLSISGFGSFIFQILAFPAIAKKLGPISTTRTSAILCLPLLAILPFLGNLQGSTQWLVLTVASVTKNALGVATLSGSYLLINNSVTRKNRGRANGFAVSLVSIIRAIGPGVGGATYAWAQSRHSAILPGGQIVFFILGVIVVVCIIFTLEPFLPRSVDTMKTEEEDLTLLPASSDNLDSSNDKS